MNDGGEPSGNGLIDAHAHVWTSDVNRYRLAPTFALSDMVPANFPADELLQTAGHSGVRRIVLIQMNFYGYDNSYMLDCLRAYPGRFSAVAQVDEHSDPTATMLRLWQQGVRGVRVRPPTPGDASWLDGPGMLAMWRCGADRAMAICLHIDAIDLPAVDRMCERFPDTPVVVDHCARIGGVGPIREEDLTQLCRLARHKLTRVKLSAFYFLGHKRPPYVDLLPMIRRLCDTFGPERLMWASDCPYQLQLPHTYEASLDLIRLHCNFLSESDQQWILGRTAERVFFAGA